MRNSGYQPLNVLFLLLFAAAGNCQSVSSVAASAVVEKAQAASLQGTPVKSIHIEGLATFTAGATHSEGPIVMDADVSGSSSVRFTDRDGVHLESQSAAVFGRTCSWSGPDGKIHDVMQFNCWTAAPWFFPHIALQSSGVPSGLIAQDLGTSSDQAGSYHSIRQQLVLGQSVASSEASNLIKKWSTFNLHIDPKSYLPTQLNYSIHPDQNGEQDIPVEVHFDDYSAVSGIQVPHHIRRYVNGSLQFDIEVSAVTIQ